MIVLDTNVLSELIRPKPDAAVMQWMSAQTDALYVAALSYVEILLGVDLLPKGRRHQRLSEQAAAMGSVKNLGQVAVCKVISLMNA